MIHFQDNFYLTWNRNLVLILLFTWICHLDLSKLKLIDSCDGCHAWGRRCLLNPEHLVVLLAGPISHTSTQDVDFVDFLHFNGSVYQLFCFFLVGVELPLHVVVTILECCVTFSGVKLSIRLFVLLQKTTCH